MSPDPNLLKKQPGSRRQRARTVGVYSFRKRPASLRTETLSFNKGEFEVRCIAGGAYACLLALSNCFLGGQKIAGCHLVYATQ